jgi:hypothetical protein
LRITFESVGALPQFEIAAAKSASNSLPLAASARHGGDQNLSAFRPLSYGFEIVAAIRRTA